MYQFVHAVVFLRSRVWNKPVKLKHNAKLGEFWANIPFPYNYQDDINFHCQPLGYLLYQQSISGIGAVSI